MREGYAHLTRERRNHIHRHRGRMSKEHIADDLGVLVG